MQTLKHRSRELGRQGRPLSESEDCALKYYFLGLIEGKHYHLLEEYAYQFTDYANECKKYAGKHQLMEVMDYFGYDKQSVQCYFSSALDNLRLFWSQKEAAKKIRELFEIMREKKADYLPLANNILNRFFTYRQELCLYLLSIGAKFDEGALMDLSIGECRYLRAYYFHEDV